MDLESFLNVIKKHDIERLENVEIEGDIEIELSGESIQAILPYLPILQEMQNFLYHANMAMSFVTKMSFMNVENISTDKNKK
ncbi:hypothetical protein DRO97_03355 [Archaeoglobales archaeon]|nr:MAG: hypothetical protein DRO97_03355 [Archaeoglobales archaeon]